MLLYVIDVNIGGGVFWRIDIWKTHGKITETLKGNSKYTGLSHIYLS